MGDRAPLVPASPPNIKGKWVLDHQTLLAALHYDPETGVWTRLLPARGVKAGSRADRGVRNRRYRHVSINKRKYPAHVLAWFYMTGRWPPIRLDHADTVGSNNSWGNLRLATQSQNLANAVLRSDNTSGFKGVYWNKTRKKWIAQICIAGKPVYLGRFNTKEEAVSARREVAVMAFGEFARHA